jgi:hypothetical protein
VNSRARRPSPSFNRTPPRTRPHTRFALPMALFSMLLTTPNVLWEPASATPSPPGNSHALVLPSSRISRRVSPRLSTTPQSRSLPTPVTTTRTSPRKTCSQSTPTPTPTPTSATLQRVRPTSTRPSPMPAAKMTVVPCEVLPPPDRRSAHYPGFDVHHDTYITLPCMRSKAQNVV